MIDKQFYNSGELSRGVFEPFYGEYRSKSVRDKIFSKSESSKRQITFVHQSSPRSSELREVTYGQSKIEFSVYDGDKNLQHWIRNEDFLIDGASFRVEVRKHIKEANVPDGGNYIFRYNFFNQFIGGPNQKTLYVASISNDKREIKVRIHPESSDQEYFNEVFSSSVEPLKYVCNFGQNRYQHVLNWDGIIRKDSSNNIIYDGDGNPSLKEAIIRFEDPISESVAVGDNFWIDFEIGRPFFDRFQIFRSEPQPKGKELAGPNFGVDFDRQKSKDSKFETLENLLQGKGFTSSKNFVKSRTSSSEAVELNIDFTEFENFIQYSSAEERIKNFRYKIKEIYQKVSKINQVDQQQAGLKKRSKERVEEIIGSFDAYEQYLFRNENGYPKNQNGGLKRPTKPEKGQLEDGTYQRELQEWQEVNSWFEDILSKASSYDDSNDSALRKQVPEFVKENEQNQSFILFVDMIGHWFDVNWIYIKHMKHLSNSEEDPYEPETLSADLSDVVVESLGFETYNGFNAKDFFDKLFDTDKVQSLFKDADLTFSSPKKVKDGKLDITRYQAQQQVWRRLLQNVMYFYKTKSTPSSIRMLTNVLGIPAGSLVVRESGGTSPDINEKTQVDEKTQYLSLFSSQSLEIPLNTSGVSKNPASLETRFRTNFQGARSLKVLELRNVAEVRMVKSGFSTNQGKTVVTIINPDGSESIVESKEHPIYNGEWTNVLVQVREDSDFVDFLIQQRSPFGNKRFEEHLPIKVSPQTSKAFRGASKLYVGGRSTGRIFTEGTTFIGNFDQVNIWNDPISEEQFDNHTFAPKRYDHKDRESIDVGFSGQVQETGLQSSEDFRGKLIFRTDFEDGASNEVKNSGIEPSIVGTGAEFEQYNRTNFFPPSQVGNTSFVKSKIRVKKDESENLNLYPDRSTKGKFRDTISEDSEQLGIYFSPNTFANRDVVSEMGIKSVNRVLGNPADQYRNDYFTLDALNYSYWQKYDDPTEVQKYIRYIDEFYDAFFDHIEKAIPARASASTGIVIEPSILERDRHKIPNGSINIK